MKVHCETPGGRVIHNVTCNREDDIESLVYLLNGIIADLRRDDLAGAARYMGTLAHLIQDSTSPAHAADLRLIQELLPPPGSPPYASRVDAVGQKLGLHAAIELTTEPFRLKRPARIAGKSVAEAAIAVLNRCYAIIRDNRAHLLEMVRATYTDDRPVMERLRSRAAKEIIWILGSRAPTRSTLARSPSLSDVNTTTRFRPREMVTYHCSALVAARLPAPARRPQRETAGVRARWTL